LNRGNTIKLKERVKIRAQRKNWRNPAEIELTYKKIRSGSSERNEKNALMMKQAC